MQIVKNEIEKIREVLVEVLGMDIELRKNSFGELVSTIEFSDGRVEIWIDISEKEFHAVIEDIDYYDRILNCFECIDCAGEDCPLYGITYEQLVEYIMREIEEYTKPRLKVAHFGTEIKIKPIVVEENDHIFKGTQISIKTQNFGEFMALLRIYPILLQFL